MSWHQAVAWGFVAVFGAALVFLILDQWFYARWAVLSAVVFSALVLAIKGLFG